MSEIQLASGAPVPEDRSHTELKANGQQKDYVVLTPEERAKGFVRTVRQTYVHVGARPKYATRDLTSEERARHKDEMYVLYEEYPPELHPVVGRYWTQKMLNNGCNGVTKMSREIAETYARQPDFYGGTFCVWCGTHLPLEQFVWEGTDEQVGS